MRSLLAALIPNRFERLGLLTSFAMIITFLAFIFSGVGKVIALRFGATSPLASVVFYTLLAFWLVCVVLVLKVLARRIIGGRQ